MIHDLSSRLVLLCTDPKVILGSIHGYETKDVCIIRGRCARQEDWQTHLGKDLAQNGDQRCQKQYVCKDDENEH